MAQCSSSGSVGEDADDDDDANDKDDDDDVKGVHAFIKEVINYSRENEASGKTDQTGL